MIGIRSICKFVPVTKPIVKITPLYRAADSERVNVAKVQQCPGRGRAHSNPLVNLRTCKSQSGDQQ